MLKRSIGNVKYLLSLLKFDILVIKQLRNLYDVVQESQENLSETSRNFITDTNNVFIFFEANTNEQGQKY